MSLVIEPTQPVPLTAGRDGVVCISHTRVTLDTVVEAFWQGATPEEIVQQYPSLSLAEIYSLVSYFLNHQTEVTNYLERRRVQHKEMRKVNERRYDPVGIRERLLARQHGSSGE